MKKKLLKEMVSASYNDEELDGKKVLKFASYLSRQELKGYIRALKEQELQRTVQIEGPDQGKRNDMKALQALFPNKKIVYKSDPTIMFGIRVTEGDVVYETSLKDSFERMMRYIAE